MRYFLGITLAAGLALVGAQVTLAHGQGHNDNNQTVEATLVGEFAEADAVELFKHHNRLFAFVETNGSVDLYGADRQGDTWEQLDSAAEPVADLLGEVTDVTAFAPFKNYLYAAVVDSNDQPAVWRIKLNGRPAVWEQSSEASFGDTTNTAIVDFARMPGEQLVAVTTNAAGNGLFATSEGVTWAQVGEYGLGLEITDALAANAVWVVGEYINLVTVSGALYQASFDDLTTWTAVTTFSDGTVTAMSGRFVATTDVDGVVRVYESDAANTFTQVGEDSLGNTANTAVTRIVNLSRRPELMVENSTEGAAYYRYNKVDATWEVLVDAGFGDSDNTAVNNSMHYRGAVYLSTVNAVAGPQIYSVK